MAHATANATSVQQGGCTLAPKCGLRATLAATLAREYRQPGRLNNESAQSDASGLERADPDRYCWPNDPSSNAAMNTAEIELFVRRHARLLALGFSDGKADRMADALKERDREGDDRRSCAECAYTRRLPCKANGPLPMAFLHRCKGFTNSQL